MKKAAICLTIIMLAVVLIACTKEEITTSNLKNITPVESFGNQMNMRELGEYNYVSSGDWLYGTEKGKYLVKTKLSDQAESKVIASTYGDRPIIAVKVYDGWIYYGIIDSEYEDDMDVDLYRIREDGSGKKKLLNGSDDSENYTITQEGLVYIKNGFIYIMNLDGTNTKRIPLEGEKAGMARGLCVDKDWIYYSDYENLYRMKPNGTNTEKLGDIGLLSCYVVDQEVIYFIRYDAKIDKINLIKKTIHGEETILTSGLLSGNFPLNISGSWIYFAEGNKIFKMKKTGRGAKTLVFEGGKGEEIRNILVYDGDVLISTTLRDVYIKKDGTIINIGE